MTDLAVAAPGARDAAPGTAVAALYAEVAGPLGGYVYQLVRDADVAADIVQEAFTRLLSRWVTVRKPRPFLFHVATNLAHDAWHAEQRKRATVRGLLDTGPDVAVAPRDPSVWDAVGRLPEQHREVVLLYYYADLPVPEVAAAVRRPAGTVKRLLAEARDRLAKTLGGNA